MSTKKKLLEAAAGAAGGEALYVEDVFSTYLYEGNGTTQTITNGIDLAGEGGAVWVKAREIDKVHLLYDNERSNLYPLIVNSTGAELSGATNGITSFNSNGFTTANLIETNNNNQPFVSWTFRKAPKFFDVVTYTGNSTSGRTIPHNLGSVPACIIVKLTSGSGGWIVYHVGADASNPEQKYLQLNSTNAVADASWPWNDTAPTDTEFTVGTGGNINNTGDTYVAYLFAHNDGDGGFGENGDQDIIKCGSYTGNGSTSNSITLGFEPQWMLIKNASSSLQWMLFDTMRGIATGADDKYLVANSSEIESPVDLLQVTSQGFELVANNGNTNSSGDTYIYIAIRRPNKPASEFAATDLFAIDTLGSTGDGAEPGFRSTLPIDMAIRADISVAHNEISSRLTQGKWMYTNLTNAEASQSLVQFDYQNGWFAITGAYTNYYSWMFRRAPGFFDVVCYEGDGQAGREVPHNLGVVPELVIHKHRSNALNWTVWHHEVSGPSRDWWEYGGVLNEDYAFGDKNLQQNAPTSSTWPVDSGWTNVSADHVLYLFATVPGISKVGSYTGTAADLNVDCGFSAGARFILIKRTDSTGDWYVWDSVRGIVAGNDPYLLLNTTAAQVTSTDYIDPLSSGFTVTSSAPAALNASGGTYIFYAIA